VSKEARSKDRSNVRSASSPYKPPILGARTDNQPKDKYKLYREPGDDSSMGVGLLAAK